jgi:hypothetical protein
MSETPHAKVGFAGRYKGDFVTVDHVENGKLALKDAGGNLLQGLVAPDNEKLNLLP